MSLYLPLSKTVSPIYHPNRPGISSENFLACQDNVQELLISWANAFLKSWKSEMPETHWVWRTIKKFYYFSTLLFVKSDLLMWYEKIVLRELFISLYTGLVKVLWPISETIERKQMPLVVVLTMFLNSVIYESGFRFLFMHYPESINRFGRVFFSYRQFWLEWPNGLILVAFNIYFP